MIHIHDVSCEVVVVVVRHLTRSVRLTLQFMGSRHNEEVELLSSLSLPPTGQPRRKRLQQPVVTTSAGNGRFSIRAVSEGG